MQFVIGRDRLGEEGETGKMARKKKFQVRPRLTTVLCVGSLLVYAVSESEKGFVGSFLNRLLDD